MHTDFMENILFVNMVDVPIPIKSISCTFRKLLWSSFFQLLSMRCTYRKGKKERPKLLKGVGQLLYIIKEGKRQQIPKVELLWAL